MAQKHPLPDLSERSSRIWFNPIVMLCTLLVVFGLITWYSEANSRRASRADLAERTKTFDGSLQLILEGNESYLSMLAFERAAGKLDQAAFQHRASEYVQAHPELINITWVDADYQIRDVAPLAQNRQIVGLTLNLPEPKRVSQLARELRQPVYTRPFEAIQGKASFEVWVPVYDHDTFLGLFAGVYSCQRLLKQLVHQTHPDRYYLSLVDRDGRLLAGLPREKDLHPTLWRKTVVTSRDSGVFLRVNRYQDGPDWRLTLLKGISALLVLAMSFALWELKREMDKRKKVQEELVKKTALLEQEVRERQEAQEHLQEQTVLLEEQINERWQAEEALRRSEEQLRLLLDSTGEGIYGIDLDGNCTFCNRALLRMLGYQSADELLGCNMHERIHHSHPDGSPMPQGECTVHRTLHQQTGAQVNNEVFWRKDGTSFPVEYWSYPQVKGGRVVGGVVTFTDVTGKKQLEEKFLQSQKMESIGRLAGGVAHDFNNMLSVILGAAELCKRRLESDEPVAPYLELIINAAARSGDITRQLLAFSRKGVVSPKPVDLNLQIRESNKIISRLIGEEVELTFRPGEGLTVVMIDPSQVDQILMNLAVNARDAMPGGGMLTIETAIVTLPKREVEPSGEAREGEYVRLTVSDTGLGMDKATLEHIFEPFFTTKEVGKGTGLGLATVYGIVTQNNGFIEVRSEPGQGATFDVYLPRLKKAEPEASLRPEPSVPLSGRVLLVEDEVMLLLLANELLVEMGLEVIQAQSPSHAIEICRDPAQRVDLVLTDLVMPEMNGREMADRIREIRPDVQIVFMSGHTSDNSVLRGVVEQGMHFIQKPLDLQKLREKMAKILLEK